MTKQKAAKKKKSVKKEVPFKERLPSIIIRTSFAVFVFCVIGLIFFTFHTLKKSDYFFIKRNDIRWLAKPEIEKDYAAILRAGIGENIMEFDIETASKRLLDANPELKEIQIIKAFPDKLVLKVEARRPAAQVGRKHFYLIDEEGVTITDVNQTIREDLPIIAGAQWRLTHKVGYRDKSPHMAKGLELLKAIWESRFLDEHTLTKIDISDKRNVTFFIEDGLEIKIGNEEFPERLGKLQKTLASLLIGRDEIKYIDLRFDDVVLGTR